MRYVALVAFLLMVLFATATPRNMPDVPASTFSGMDECRKLGGKAVMERWLGHGLVFRGCVVDAGKF